MRLRRWLALLVAGTLVPFLAFSLAAVYQYGREQGAAAEHALQDAARALAVVLDKHLDTTITALRVLGTSSRLDAGDLPAFHTQCLRVLGVNAEWRVISLFDAGGRRLLITSEPFGAILPPVPGPLSERFRRLVDTQAPGVSDLFASPLNKRLGVSVGVPVVRGGEVRWVLSAGMTADGLGQLLASQRVLPGSIGVILDRRHVIVAHSHAPQLIGTAASPGLIERATAAAEGTVRAGAADNVPALTAFSRSPAFGWTVAISVPVAGGPVLAPVRAILTVGAALLLVGVAVALWVGRRISQPIEMLAAAARRLGRGEAVDLVASRVTEVSALAEALAGAAQDRDQAQAELARYAERLRILHEIDQALMAATAPAAVAQAALRRLRPLLGAPRAVVTLFDLEAGEGEWLAVDAATPSAVGAGSRFPLEMMGDLAALQRGEVQTIGDVSVFAHLPPAQTLLDEGVHSYLVVPLVTGGALIGSLNFASGASGGFPAEHLAIAREVAVQLAIVIVQARLHDRVRRHAEELELRVAERTAAADRANQAKSEFLSRMSHELRTPLNSILGFGQVLELDELPAKQRDCVEHILTSGRHLLGLINEVLEISRIEAGHLRLSLEPVRVAETLRSAMDLVRPLATPRGIQLRAELPDEQRHVLGDRQRLQQVLLNLLANAVKYNRDNGLVTVTCVDVPPVSLQIVVTDTGPGIRPEDLARLFTPFERFGAEGGGVEGSGLGLALSKHLVDAMNGTLEAASEVGVGSRFALALPLVEAPAVEVMPPDSPGLPAWSRGGVVLYIEDNLSNYRLVERVLELIPGTTLLSAIQGRLGLELAREHRPDVILLDLHLPDVPGEEVLRRLLAEPRTRQIPVIILSADATPGQIERLLAAGARAFLTKPIDVRRFLAVLGEQMGTEPRGSAG